ncbi:MAG: DUF2334 domain-containing protein [Lachnospiraceae bacterium]|nr:DUF2334 domain-containing protein [Lachnospiraceae bacterium]
MKIAIRLDDITPDMDWEKFRRFEKLLDEYRIAPLIGVVPDNQDPSLARNPKMKDFEVQIQKWKEKDWVLAMHGWKHIYTTQKGGLFPLNCFSEYAGLPRDKQREMILDGKEKLQKIGIQTNVFMAPAHSFDKNTLFVLKEAGFRYITDGFGDFPYEWKGLTFLPIAFQKNKDIEKNSGYTTLVVHTNTMNDKDFENFEKILKTHKEDFISYKEYLDVPVKKQSIMGRSKEYAMATMKRLLVTLYTLKTGASKKEA